MNGDVPSISSTGRVGVMIADPRLLQLCPLEVRLANRWEAQIWRGALTAMAVLELIGIDRG